MRKVRLIPFFEMNNQEEEEEIWNVNKKSKNEKYFFIHFLN